MMSLCLSTSLVLRGYIRILMKLKVKMINHGNVVLISAN